MKISGIKAKAVMYTIIPVMIGFLITGTILFVSLFNSLYNSTKSEFINIALKHTSTIERKLKNAVDYLSFITSIIEYQVKTNETDRESLQQMLYAIFSEQTIDSSSIYFEPDMYDGKDAQYAGTQYGSAPSGRISFYYYHKDEKTVYLPQAIENDFEFTLPLYIDAKTSNSPIYTEPLLFEIEGEEVFMCLIVFPIRDQNNKFIGAVTADIHLGDIYSQLQAEEIYKTGYMVIGNDKNQVIYSPIFEDIGKDRYEAGFSYSLPSTSEETVVFRARSILNQKRTLIAINSIYIPQLDSHFYISVAAPISEINEKGTILLIFILTLSTAIVLLITMILFYMISRLVNPLKEFTEIAEKIGKGDFSSKIKGDYKDEFGVLKDTLNQMIKRIERNVIESKKAQSLLHKILNGIDAYIYVTVPETGEILFINDQMRKLFQLEKETGIGDYCYKLFRNLDHKCEFCPCFELDKNPDFPVIWEEQIKELKRDIRHTDCYIDWIDGSKVHLQHAFDVTDIKLITAEKLIAEQKKERAEETSRMKSVFLASMSHEIRTPMHGIIGFSELALDDEIPLKTKNYLTKIKTSAESLLMIINDILDVSKVEAGKMELEKIPFDVNEVFKLCRLISTPKAQEKGLTLFCYAEPSIGRLLIGDPTRLRQILLNLLSNAIKFTNTGMVKMLSAISDRTDNSITMHFEVKDSGIGMTKDQLDRVFNPFTQADESTTRRFGGTGLGLTISKSFIELMGGTLNVETTYGLGSKFSFEIKFDTINVTAGLTRKPEIVSHKEKPVFKGEVLVCEDNTLNQIVIVDHLKKVGLQSIIAVNGKEGVELVKERKENNEKPFDLIFMDIHMPVMDGLEASKKIIEMNTNTPIVALTANIMSDDRETYIKAGMVDCLSKPFIATDLWSCLLKYINPVNLLTEKKETTLSEDEEHRIELIKMFIKSNQTTIKDINEALAADDKKLAHRLAHTLKGVAGIVGQTSLSKAAQTVEKSISDNQLELLNEQMNILETELNSAMNELHSML